MKQFVLAALVICSLAACASHGDTVTINSGTVIRNVTVVDTRDGALSAGMTLVLDGARIARIVAGPVLTGGDARAVDGAGRFVVPGYLDMHSHAMLAAGKPVTYWPLLVANGVTGVREMGGSAELIRFAHAINADSAAGKLDAPEILAIPGDILAGPMTPEQGAQRVRQQKAMGADFIKIASGNHDGTMAVLGEARAQGLTVSGHLPVAVGATEAADAGWRAIEHLGSGLGIALDCSDAEAKVRGAMLRGEGAPPPPPAAMPLAIVSPMLFRALDAPFYQQVMDGYSEAKCAALARRFAERDTWQVPTLIRLRTAAYSASQQYRADPALAYVDKDTRALWEQLARQYAAGVPPSAAATFERYYGLQQKIVALMARNGVRMMAGSDVGGIWVLPGVGLHQEFHELAAAGLSPLQILQMATLNGAAFLHREASMGTVAAGRNADLVLLDANPLANAANLSRISAVVLKGRYFDREALDAMKAAAAAAYRQPVQGAQAALDPDHRH
jgi:imidazolonepropionase-like amidohydrolase